MEQTITEAAVTPQGGKRLAGGGKKIPLIILGAVLAAVLAVYLGLCGWAASLDTFYPNTSLNGVKIGGLTVFQAAERMAQELPQKTLEFYLPLADETGDGISAPEGEVLYEQAPRCHRHLRGAGPYPNAGLYGRCGVCAAGGPEKPLLFQRRMGLSCPPFWLARQRRGPPGAGRCCFSKQAGRPGQPVFPRAPGHLF